MYIDYYDSPMGKMMMAANENGLTGLWFCGQKYFPVGLEERSENEYPDLFCDTKKWLDQYFQGIDPGPIPELSLHGTPFQMMVWEELQKIPYGTTTTYGRIGRIIAEKRELKSMSAQAIGQAVGHNPVSVIVPCHRVLASDGSLHGYAGGIDKKKRLLEIEMEDYGKKL